MGDKGNDGREALVHGIMRSPISPERIEEMSFEAIDAEAPAHGYSADEWVVVKRLVHTTADFGLVGDVVFSPDAISSAAAALRVGAPVFADSNMIRAGLSAARLRRVCDKYSKERIYCHVADDDVAAEAKAAGLPRSLYAARKAKGILDGGIALFGNAPVALMELNRMIIEEGVRPALVIAMPVGFVHVVESKDELMELGAPYVAVRGRRGGSTLAVAALHALCGLAERETGGNC